MNGNVVSPPLPRWRGWTPLFVLPTVVAVVAVFAPAAWPRWALMWALAFAILAGCKWLTWRRTPMPGAPWWRHAGYLLAWPGLDAQSFLDPARSPIPPQPLLREWATAVLKILAGAFLFWIVASWTPADQPLLFGWTGMIGLILLLHFGFFHLLSCIWRSLGVEARPLMNRPLFSVSVSEFWGRRWNTAFRDLTYRFLFRPLSSWRGPRWAIAAGFFFSGVVHDLVISIPSGGGYGWPTVFFLVQAVAMFVERSGPGRAIGLGRGLRGWLFTMLVLVVPVFGLFHPPFVIHIIVPFMEALGCRRR